MSVKAKVLIIDDEPAIRMNFQEYLEDSEYSVITAPNGITGINKFKKESPDIVLVDLQMPVMHGLEVLSTITDLSPETPIIIISGTGKMSDVIEALRGGAWDYITKPVEDMAIIEIAVEKALKKVQIIEENEKYKTNLEELVLNRTVKLRQSEQLHRIVSDFISDFVYMQRADENSDEFSFWITGAVEKITGYEKEIFTSKKKLWKSIICEQDIARYKDSVKKVLDGENVKIEYSIINKASEKRIIKEYSRPFVDQKTGKVIEIIGAIKDVTEERALRKQLFQAQKMDALGLLAAGVAHDFNNILTAILGYVDIIKAEIPPAKITDEFLDEIKTAGGRAKDLIRRILSFSREDEEVLQVVSLKKIIEEVYKMIKSTFPKTVKIITEIDTEGNVLADFTNIEQVLLNLTNNSLQAISKSKGRITIGLKQIAFDEIPIDLKPNMESKKYYCVYVRDNGKGIPQANLEKIFDPYFTTKSKDEGTGLGLAIVHSVVNDYGGAVDVISELNSFTEFRLYFPVLDK